jgi:O-methyltransferase
MTPSLTIDRVHRGVRRRARGVSIAARLLAQRWVSARRYASLHQKYRDYTMIPPRSWHDNLALCDLHAHKPGCLVECGVWRGGMSAAMAEILGPGRTSYLFDSFEGLPPADAALDGAWAVKWQADVTGTHYYDNCRAEQAEAEAAMRLAGVATPHLIRGWFKDTVPTFVPAEPIRVLRLDADWYESTRLCLETLNPHVASGGLILIDAYFVWDGCARAVHEYLATLTGHPDRIRETRRGVAYVVKGSAYSVPMPL